MDTRLHPLALDEMPQALQEVLQPIYERLGYLGEFFQYTAHAPGVLNQFMAYTSELRSVIPPDLNELIALTVCTRLDFAYERNQHERLALRLGFSEAWIGRLTNRSQLAPLSEVQSDVQALVFAVLDDDTAAAREMLAPVIAHCGPEIAIAVLFQINRFSTICSVGKIFPVMTQVKSIFDDCCIYR